MDEDPSDYEILKAMDQRKPRVSKEPVSKAKNERQYWLECTVVMLKKPWPMIAKKVEGWPVSWLKDMYLYVNRAEVTNPAALWWWYYNKKVNEKDQA